MKSGRAKINSLSESGFRFASLPLFSYKNFSLPEDEISSYQPVYNLNLSLKFWNVLFVIVQQFILPLSLPPLQFKLLTGNFIMLKLHFSKFKITYYLLLIKFKLLHVFYLTYLQPLTWKPNSFLTSFSKLRYTWFCSFICFFHVYSCISSFYSQSHQLFLPIA